METQQKCYKCDSARLLKDSWAKVISPNLYELFDKVMCQDCKVVKIEDIKRINHNTDNTRKLIAGTHYVNKKGDVVLKKRESIINLKEIFPD